jgi:hypothetical protein
MQEEIEVLREYVKSLGLHEKEGITLEDKRELELMLRDAHEKGLADYVKNLANANELEDLILNVLYG